MAIVNIEKWNMDDLIDLYKHMEKDNCKALADWHYIKRIYHNVMKILNVLIESLDSYEPVELASPILRAYDNGIRIIGIVDDENPIVICTHQDVVAIHYYRVQAEKCYEKLKKMGWKI